MRFDPPLQQGILIRRYKRFLADVTLDNGTSMTVHVPNTGSMKSTRTPGSPVALSYHPSLTRKYSHTLELVSVAGCWVGVNTARPNALAAEAIGAGHIPALQGYPHLRREAPLGERGRVDILLSNEEQQCFVEVKNVTWREGRRALFPDAVTERGTRHLRELRARVAQGDRAVMLFLVNRSDCDAMSPATELDPLYASTLTQVMTEGVEAMAFRVHNSLTESVLDREVPILL